MIIKRNIGDIDRVFRFVVGLSMIFYGFVDQELISDQLAAYLLGTFGVIVFSSSMAGSCPLYNMIDLNTYDKNKS